MTTNPTDSPKTTASDFAHQSEEAAPGIVREFIDFLGENKKWWLIPIILAIGLICGMVILSSTPLAPLIYPLF